MTRYALLDTIADAYTPALGLIWLLACGLCWHRYGASSGWTRLALGLGGVLVVYGFAWLDARAGLWPRLGLDYSTHTAIALAFATAIGARWPRAWPALAMSLLAYAALMRYQRYHTLADIGSTAAAIALPLAVLAYGLRRKLAAPCGSVPKTALPSREQGPRIEP